MRLENGDGFKEQKRFIIDQLIDRSADATLCNELFLQLIRNVRGHVSRDLERKAWLLLAALAPQGPCGPVRTSFTLLKTRFVF